MGLKFIYAGKQVSYRSATSSLKLTKFSLGNSMWHEETLKVRKSHFSVIGEHFVNQDLVSRGCLR